MNDDYRRLRLDAALVIIYIENTSWKVLAYGIYTRVVDVSAQRTSEISDTKTTSG